MNQMGTNLQDEILRDVNEKLLIASIEQQELAEIATQAEQRLYALVNGLNAVICELDIQTGEILFLSERAESFLGYARFEWNRRGFWRRVIYPDDRAETLAFLYRAIETRQDNEHEFRALTADGRTVWIRNQAVIVTDGDGTPRLIRCVLEDVSERKQSEEIIAHSERRFRRLFEAAQDGILILDSNNGVITDANPVATKLLGMSHDALMGKEFFEVGLFADQEKSRAVLTSLKENHSILCENLSISSTEGVDRTVEVVGYLYRENGISVVQCHIRDVTERKRLEALQDEALQRELRITEFLQRPLRTNFHEDEFESLSLAALYEPALKEAEVGGDFFDAFMVGKSVRSHRIVLCVGDVMGKGLKAASLAARLKEVLHAFIGENHDPGHTLFRLNNYLCDITRGNSAEYPPDIFPALSLAALSIAVIDPATGVATISTAGAEPVAVLRAMSHAEEVAVTGVTLGIERDEIFTNAQITLHPGDTLLITTDGLTEARRVKEFLGYDGLVEIALRNVSAPSISAMGRAIVEDARAFGGSFKDDVCLLLARRK
ncbi:MAG: SpoIIE family protein phosphatase [Fibrella sp.]|nr:SpoIIE family protein phosphatase [Armatimonadota bacterium]